MFDKLISIQTKWNASVLLERIMIKMTNVFLIESYSLPNLKAQ